MWLVKTLLLPLLCQNKLNYLFRWVTFLLAWIPFSFKPTSIHVPSICSVYHWFCGHLFPDYGKKRENKNNNRPLVLNAAFFLVSDSSWTASRWVSSWISASVLHRFVTHPHMAVSEPKLWAFRTSGGWFQPISFHVCGRFLSERFRLSM